MADDVASSGLRAQFAVLFAAQRGTLVRSLARLIGDRHTAEDLAQDAYLKVAAAAETGKVEHLQPFLYQTARNLAFDHLRKQKVRAVVHPLPGAASDAVIAAVPAAEPSPEARMLDRDRVRRFQVALADLPERARQVLLLHRLHGLSQTEIARRFGVSERTIAKDLARALAHCLAADDSD
ncbi:MAG: RNA polymerase sigma factor [Ferrovibrio sp.]|uniref:RNA polymerase sigma factor n=1 Tax=Ferrovibrio sp. TaxID=1917215 RepID=UPI00261E7963|nr:RNA polymerase sigma factor [Ferrovibrio sp.]MCW0233701.1 RNA polymerase sigma factor [Ferrovibrio sp.]